VCQYTSTWLIFGLAGSDTSSFVKQRKDADSEI